MLQRKIQPFLSSLLIFIYRYPFLLPTASPNLGNAINFKTRKIGNAGRLLTDVNRCRSTMLESNDEIREIIGIDVLNYNQRRIKIIKLNIKDIYLD